MKSGVKPCPFCGAEADRFVHYDKVGDVIEACGQCSACGARGPCYKCNDHDLSGRNQETLGVTELWNRRVE